MTVWNHIGKKYMTEKLQTATNKLLIPTSTGTFCLSSDGTSTGSMASLSSINKNSRKHVMADTRAPMTRGWSHYPVFKDGFLTKRKSGVPEVDHCNGSPTTTK
jgi:hypothetical protein